MPGPHSPRQTDLLAALPVGEPEHLYPYLERVRLTLGEVLYESGDQLQHVYFSTDLGAAALVAALHPGLADTDSQTAGLIHYSRGNTRARYAGGAISSRPPWRARSAWIFLIMSCAAASQ